MGLTQAAPTPMPVHPNLVETVVFSALSLSASQATLWLDSFGFIINAEETVTLDLGAHQTVGEPGASMRPWKWLGIRFT